MTGDVQSFTKSCRPIFKK